MEDLGQEREEQIKSLKSSLEMEQDRHQETINHSRQLEASHKEVLQEMEERIMTLSSSLEMAQEQHKATSNKLQELEVSHKDALQEMEERIMELSTSLEMEQEQHQEAISHLRRLESTHKGTLQELNSAMNEMNRLRSKCESQQQQLRDSARFIREQDRCMKNVKSHVAALCTNINEWSNYEDLPWMTDSRHEDSKGTPPRKNAISHVAADELAKMQRSPQSQPDQLLEEDCDEVKLWDETPTIEIRETEKGQNVSATFSRKSLKIDQSQKDALSTTANDQMLSMAWNEIDGTPSNLDDVIAPNDTALAMVEANADEILVDHNPQVAIVEKSGVIENESAPVEQSPHWWEQEPIDNINDLNPDEVKRLFMDPEEMDNIQNISAILPEESCHHSDDSEGHDYVHQVHVSQSVDDEGNNDENLGMEVTVVKTKTNLDGSLEKSENTAMMTEISNAETDHNEDMSVVSLVRDFVSIREID
jgi:hypothetical protein